MFVFCDLWLACQSKTRAVKAAKSEGMASQMGLHTAQFQTTLAESAEDLRAAQALRYQVFVQEMGATGPAVCHDQLLEADALDRFCDHLLLRDMARDGQVVGVYRLLRQDQAAQTRGFYSEAEFDLTALHGSGKRLLELGRSCLHPEYRGGAALFHLWSGLAGYVAAHEIDIVFGVASFPGTDTARLGAPLSLLHHRYRSPAALRTVSRQVQTGVELLPIEKVQTKAAMLQVPALIKGYLKMGGTIGDGVFVDHAFNTTDICIVLAADQINARQRGVLERSGQRGSIL